MVEKLPRRSLDALLKQFGGLRDSEPFQLPASSFLLYAGTRLFDKLNGGLIARGVERCLPSASNGDFGVFGICGPCELLESGQ